MGMILDIIDAKRDYISRGDYITAEKMRQIEYNLKYGHTEPKIISNTYNRIFPVDQQISATQRRLILPFEYKHRNDFIITIDSGFYWDGASIPRVAWSIVGSPFTGTYTVAALIHDALYGGELLPRNDCDMVFREIMIDWEVSFIKRNTMYGAVRSCGWSVWNSHKPEEIKGIKKHIEFVEVA